MPAKRRGFTALELLITMAIAVILLATAVPALRDYHWNLRIATAMDTLQTDFEFARGYAISHNIRTVVCPAPDERECSLEAGWQHGWMVFADMNADLERQEGEPLLKQGNAVEMLDVRGSRYRNYLRFYPNGSAPGSNLSIVFCDHRGAKFAGKILVSNTGRIRQQRKGTQSSENCP